ncbi:MAG: adenylate/guanylate cyclase domain-containing protein [Nitrospirae bacterium]|nr:adenylate/guanylate cyclase domain-containing protein [Nitrospirota bacterium]
MANRNGLPLELRIGISTGHAISGVLGRKTPHLDIWGETVNLASRMESTGMPGQIQVSESTYWRLWTQY